MGSSRGIAFYIGLAEPMFVNLYAVPYIKCNNIIYKFGGVKIKSSFLNKLLPKISHFWQKNCHDISQKSEPRDGSVGRVGREAGAVTGARSTALPALALRRRALAAARR